MAAAWDRSLREKGRQTTKSKKSVRLAVGHILPLTIPCLCSFANVYISRSWLIFPGCCFFFFSAEQLGSAFFLFLFSLLKIQILPLPVLALSTQVSISGFDSGLGFPVTQSSPSNVSISCSDSEIRTPLILIWGLLALSSASGQTLRQAQVPGHQCLRLRAEAGEGTVFP